MAYKLEMLKADGTVVFDSSPTLQITHYIDQYVSNSQQYEITPSEPINEEYTNAVYIAVIPYEERVVSGNAKIQGINETGVRLRALPTAELKNGKINLDARKASSGGLGVLVMREA